MSNRPVTMAAIFAAGALVAGAASAAPLQVTITNQQAADGIFITPLFAHFHDGSFDPFDAGAPASAAVEALAEGGDTSGLEAAAPGSQTIAAPGGFPGAPVIDPGESASARFDVAAVGDVFFTFLSMVIPSNDIFIGNDDPFAYQVFENGIFSNPGVIQIFASDAWDAGTEVNNGEGAPFNPTGGTATEEMANITQLVDLSVLLGEPRAVGGIVASGTGAGSLIATIEIAAVPLPAGLPLLLAGLGAFGLMSRRKAA